MSYTIDHFQTLRQRFPTWDELKAHLLSAAGVQPVTNEIAPRYTILRYVKGRPHLPVHELGVDLFRSVVWDTVENRPVCVAPPRAREGLPVASAAPLAATEDFIDGVMVNVFVSAEDRSALHVATRTVLGGNCTFYGEKPFAEMFDDALSSTPLKDRAGLRESLAAVLDQVAGSTAVFASFVLQHPDHRVVAKIIVPSLYCVHVGTVGGDAAVQMSERATNWPQGLARLQVPSYPIRQFRSEEEIEDLLRKTAAQRGWRWQGLVFKDGYGGRWRVRSPTYLMLRELRGSESKMVDRFLRLRSEKKVKEYLTHYGEDRTLMWDLEQKLRARTEDALAAYVDVHKAHAVAFKDLPAAYKPVVYLAHVQWRNELREKGFKVRLQNVVAVINGLRQFEQRRLLEAEPYVAAVPTPAPAAGAEEEADTAVHTAAGQDTVEGQ